LPVFEDFYNKKVSINGAEKEKQVHNKSNKTIEEDRYTGFSSDTNSDSDYELIGKSLVNDKFLNSHSNPAKLENYFTYPVDESRDFSKKMISKDTNKKDIIKHISKYSFNKYGKNTEYIDTKPQERLSLDVKIKSGVAEKRYGFSQR
jgi:hypothetical protein